MIFRTFMKKSTLIIGLATTAIAVGVLSSCKDTTPEGVVPVKPFNIERYMGKWYEIARLDFKYERDLNNVTAQYTLNPNGTVKVVNRGYNYKKNEWKEAKGKAKFAGSRDEAKLKVSFFGPFFSGYNVIAIDPGYKYALIAGESLEYLWLLSREKTMPEEIKLAYLEKAKVIGYDISNLVWVEHGE